MDTAIDLPPGKTEHLDLQVKSPGKLDGNCDAGCGCGTVCMRFKVMAKTPSEFNSWVAHERTHPESPGGTQHSAAPACALNKAIDRRGKRPTGGAAKPALRTSRFGRAVHVAGERKLGTFDG
jgi:heme/copper-type cytochrome/quinol oxidase subunit 2